MNPCVLIPTYNNARTLKEVVEGAREHAPALPILVVDDGSTDETREVLDGIDSITVLRHSKNRGKGAALRTGLSHALEVGFTHAVTIDSDGQHPPAMLPRLIEASGDALVVGARDLKAAGAGLGSRIGCKNSNFWTFVETGKRLPDTLSGLRSYPLKALDPLRLTCNRYGFEIEVLVKASWSGIEIRSVPVEVRYGDEYVSHMRPVIDFFRIARLNTRLVFLRICLPAPYLALVCRRRFHDMSLGRRIRESLGELFLREPGPPRRVALSVALGLFMGLAPIWGFQIATTLLAAHATGLSKPVAVVASHISVPVFIPAILYASLLLGRLALGTHEGAVSSVDLAPSDLPAWIVGSFLLAAATAVVGGLLTYLLVKWFRKG